MCGHAAVQSGHKQDFNGQALQRRGRAAPNREITCALSQ